MFLWISINFGQATFIEGALKYGKTIYGLIHRKIWKPAKAFYKLDDSNWAYTLLKPADLITDCMFQQDKMPLSSQRPLFDHSFC